MLAAPSLSPEPTAELRLAYAIANFFADRRPEIYEDVLLDCIKTPDTLLSAFKHDPALIIGTAAKSRRTQPRIFTAILNGLKPFPVQFKLFIKAIMFSDQNVYTAIMDQISFSELPTHDLPLKINIEILFECVRRAREQGCTTQLADFLKTPNFLTDPLADPSIAVSRRMFEVFTWVLGFDAQKYGLLQQGVLNLLMGFPHLPQNFINSFVEVRGDSIRTRSELLGKALGAALVGNDSFLLLLLKNIGSQHFDLDFSKNGEKILYLHDLIAIYCQTPGMNAGAKHQLETLCVEKGVSKVELVKSANSLHSSIYRGDLNAVKAVIKAAGE